MFKLIDKIFTPKPINTHNLFWVLWFIALIILIPFVIQDILDMKTDSGKSLKLENGYEIYSVINKPEFKLIYITKDKNIKNSLIKIDNQWLVLE